jgi:pimeloyl-ACP methyl ester carboxylesterase
MPWARVIVVAGVSHAVPLEAPGALARAIIR